MRLGLWRSIRRCATANTITTSRFAALHSQNAAALLPLRHFSSTSDTPKNTSADAKMPSPEFDLLGLQHGKSPPAVDESIRAKESAAAAAAAEEQAEPELLPTFRSDDLLIDHVVALVNASHWRDLFAKLAFVGDQVKTQHVPEIIRRCADSPCVFSFFMWIRARRHVPMHPTVMPLLFDLLRPKDQPEELRWLIFEMHYHGMPLDDSMFVSALLAFARQGRIDQATRLFLKMDALGIKPPKTSTFNCILRLLLDAGRNAQFDMIFARLRRFRKLNAISHELLVVKTARYNTAESAYKFHQEMKSEGHELSPAGYVELVNSLSRCGREDLALVLLSEMKSPSAEAHDHLVVNLIKAGKLTSGLQQYKRMLETGLKPSPGTCSAILSELVVTEKPAQACTLFKEMVKSGFVTPSEVVTVVNSAYGSCKMEIVWSFLKEVPGLDIGLEPGTVHELLAELVKKRDRIDLGRKLFRGFVDAKVGIGVETYNLFLQKLGPDGGRQVFELMRGAGCEPDVHSYNWMMNSLVKENQLGEAYGLFREMTEKGAAVDAFTYKLVLQMLSRNEGMSSGEVMEGLSRMRDKGGFEAAGSYLEKLAAGNLVPERVRDRKSGKVLVKILQKNGKGLDEIYL